MTPEQRKALREPFPAEMVGKLPKGGVTIDYVGHGAVTDRLLEVDPEWQWEPLSVDEHGFPRLDADGNLWIKLTVCGVTRLGVGDGPNMKVLIGDALRNAAMRFGVALDLWIRGHAEDDEKVEQQPARRRQAQPKPVHPEVQKLVDLMNGIEDAEVRKTVKSEFVATFGQPADFELGLLEQAELFIVESVQDLTKAEAKAAGQEQNSDEIPGSDADAPAPDCPIVKPATNSPVAAARAALDKVKAKDDAA